MTSVSITLNILLGPEEKITTPTVVTNQYVSTVAEPVVSYLDIPLCKEITPVIDLTQDGDDILIDVNEIKEKMVVPEIVSNEKLFGKLTMRDVLKRDLKVFAMFTKPTMRDSRCVLIVITTLLMAILYLCILTIVILNNPADF